MHLSLFVAATLSLLAAAAPASDTSSLVIRDTPNLDAAMIYICQNKRSKDPCQAQPIPMGQCTGLSNGYAGNTKSAQNLSKGVKCTWFLSDDCSGKTYGNQNDQDLTDGNGQFAHMRAVKCQ